MKEISTALKERLFQVITGQTVLAEFESWLYQQEDLSGRINEEFYLELFSFNHKQKDARYLLKQALKKCFNEVELRLSQLMVIIKGLASSDELNEKLLTEIHKIWLNEGYEFLEPLAFYYYELSDGWIKPDRELLGRDSSELALKLLNKLEAEGQKEDFDISLFEFLPEESNPCQKIDCTGKNEEKGSLKIKKRRVWWRFWT